jgi:hypothetical protein
LFRAFSIAVLAPSSAALRKRGWEEEARLAQVLYTLMASMFRASSTAVLAASSRGGQACTGNLYPLSLLNSGAPDLLKRRPGLHTGII